MTKPLNPNAAALIRSHAALVEALSEHVNAYAKYESVRGIGGPDAFKAFAATLAADLKARAALIAAAALIESQPEGLFA